MPDRPDRTLEELADGIRDGSLAGLPLAKRLTMALADVLLVVRRDMDALADAARESGHPVARRSYDSAAGLTFAARGYVTTHVEQLLTLAERSFEHAVRDEAPLTLATTAVPDPGYPDAA